MPTERDLVRKLVQQLQDYEVEMMALNATLAAMRVTHREFPALEWLEEMRQHPEFGDDVQRRYKPFLQAMEWADAADLLNMMPPSKYPN